MKQFLSIFIPTLESRPQFVAIFPTLKRFLISANYENENDSFVDDRFLSEVKLSP